MRFKIDENLHDEYQFSSTDDDGSGRIKGDGDQFGGCSVSQVGYGCFFGLPRERNVCSKRELRERQEMIPVPLNSNIKFEH